MKSNSSPRGYISPSQMVLFLKDKNLYYQVYFEGLQQFKTKFLTLGKRLATGLEKGKDEEKDPMFEKIIKLTPQYPNREYEMREMLDEVPLFGKLDGFEKDTLTIHEVKSGKRWTQGMADNLDQITFYTLLVWLRYKTLPQAIFVHWARTAEDEEGKLTLTGDIKTFRTKRSLAQIIVFSAKVKQVWKEICELGEFMKVI